MSPREQAQRQIADYLTEHSDYFNAPYGVIEGLQPAGRGKVRTITFGVAVLLDACIKIWTPTNIEVEASGRLGYKVEGTFSSVDAVLDNLTNLRTGKNSG